MRLRMSILASAVALLLMAIPPSAANAAGTFCADDPIDDLLPEPTAIGGNGPGAPDIVQVCAESDGSDLTITVEFNEPIVPPPRGGDEARGVFPAGAIPVNAVSGFIDFDTDQNPDTWLAGPIGNVTQFCDPSGMGVDAYAGVFAGDRLAFFNSNGVFSYPIAFTSSSFAVTIPLSELGGDTDFNFGVVMGNLDMATDCFPGEEGFVTPFEDKEPPVTPTSREPEPTPGDAAVDLTPIDSTATVVVTNLPATGTGGSSRTSIALLGLGGAGVLFAGAAERLATRWRWH